MNKNTLEKFKEHARSQYPNECCAIIIGKGRKEIYLPCDNIADDKKERFKISPEDYARAEEAGKVLAIAHSHPDGSALASEADKLACEASGVKWYILALNESEYGELTEIKPSGYVAPLIGREFVHGVTDCYSIVKDYYEREFNIFLNNYARDDDWWDKGQNLYIDNYEDAGFYKLDKNYRLEVGDVIIMQINSPVPNHAAVYLGDSELKEHKSLARVKDAMLHHRYGRLSERAIYGGYWQEATSFVLRHPDAKLTEQN